MSELRRQISVLSETEVTKSGTDSDSSRKLVRRKRYFHYYLLLPATKLGQGNIFRSVCQEFCSHPGAVHAGRYGQQAGGTHPTGMHTCYQVFTLVNLFIFE